MAKKVKKSFTVAVVSDVHFPSHDDRMWQAFKQWARGDYRPDLVVYAGDIWDLPSLSRFPLEQDTPLMVADAIKLGLDELHDVPCPGYLMIGNHEVRWRKMFQEWAAYLDGCKGLTFSDQTYALGLDRKQYRWVFETKRNHGLYLGTGEARTLIRHGHNQMKSGGKYVAGRMLDRSPHVNQIVGHIHKAQMYCYTSLGRLRWSICNPTMQPPQEFCKDPNWQWGFTVLEFYGGRSINTCSKVTPRIVLMHPDGTFCYGGQLYEAA